MTAALYLYSQSWFSSLYCNRFGSGCHPYLANITAQEPYYRPNGSWLYEDGLEHVFWGLPFISAGLGATFSGSGLVPCARDEPSYLEVAGRNRDADPDETAGSVEADKTLGEAACGSDKSADLFFLSSIPKGNLGPALRREPAYEDAQDE